MARRPDADALVLEHIGLVEKLARRLARRLPPSVVLDDLVSAGHEGILEAARRFEPTRGVPFQTFAEFRVRGAMMDSIRAADSTSRYFRTHATAIRRAEERVGADPAAVARELGITARELDVLRRKTNSVSVSSLSNKAIAKYADAKAHEPPVGISRLAAAETKKRLTRAIRRLPVREQYVLALYYQEDLKLREIGETLGVSESRICQVMASALRRLRETLSEEDIP